MILTTHALVGAAIGSEIKNPWIIIPVVLVIHYFLDSFRHGEYIDDRKDGVKSAWWKIIIDLSIGFSIIFSFIHLNGSDLKIISNILIGTFFSMFPDLLTLLHWKFKNNKTLRKIKKIHSFAHRYTKFPKYSPERQWTLRNAVNDILVSILAIFILFI